MPVPRWRSGLGAGLRAIADRLDPARPGSSGSRSGSAWSHPAAPGGGRSESRTAPSGGHSLDLDGAPAHWVARLEAAGLLGDGAAPSASASGSGGSRWRRVGSGRSRRAPRRAWFSRSVESVPHRRSTARPGPGEPGEAPVPRADRGRVPSSARRRRRGSGARGAGGGQDGSGGDGLRGAGRQVRSADDPGDGDADGSSGQAPGPARGAARDRGPDPGSQPRRPRVHLRLPAPARAPAAGPAPAPRPGSRATEPSPVPGEAAALGASGHHRAGAPRLRLPAPERPKARRPDAPPEQDVAAPDGRRPSERVAEDGLGQAQAQAQAPAVTDSESRIDRLPTQALAPRGRSRSPETAGEEEGGPVHGGPRARRPDPLAPPVRLHRAEEALPALSRPRSESIRSGVGSRGPGEGLATGALGVPGPAASDPWPALPLRPAAPSSPEPGRRVARDLARAERLTREQAAV